MIQRIQTLYLLIVATLQTILLFSKQASFITTLGEEEFRVSSLWPMAVLIGITVLLAFFCIFIYRRRVIQIRLCVFNALLLLMLQAVVIYMLLRASGLSQESRYSFTAIFPIISVVLTYLAIRAIGKDEAMIRALNRIR